jgi:plastocyanin
MNPSARTRPWAFALALCLLAAGAAPAATLQVTVLARDGQPLSDAVVILEPMDSVSRPKAPPPVDAVIAQQKMQFLPALSLVPAGSRITFTNLDRWEHHVRGLPAGLPALTGTATGGFELRLGGKAEGKAAESSTLTLDRPGPMQLGCHLHGSMRGSIYVTDTPWAVKTNAQGVATLPDVREGAARLRVWHADQLLDAAPTAITVTPVTAVSLETRIQPRRRRS